MTMSWSRRVLAGSTAVVAIAALAAIALLRPSTPPSFVDVRARYVPSDAYLLDRHGAVLDTQRIDLTVRRLAWTPLEDVSPALVVAVVDGEDRRFWRHEGVDWLGVAGAMRDRILGHSRRGASTITMQLASLLDFPSRPRVGPRDFSEKLHQAQLAIGLEQSWSKREILEAYFNLIQFRGELQGIRAASEVLARKAPSGLSAAESTVLAALLPNPSTSPQLVASRGCTRAAASRAAVDCAEIKSAAITLLSRPSEAVSTGRLAPHLARALLKAPGERLGTTLDAGIQRLAHDALARQLAGLRVRNVRDGAALVVDNATGDVLAYVGSAGPNSSAAEVDGVRARRQAGSTLKPFLYELALERRYLTAASLLDDSPLNIDTATGIYFPQDYDHDYKGPVSMRTALGGSLNVPAVRTVMLVGVEAFRDRLHTLGYSTIAESGEYYGYSLALGSAEVTLWEQAQAYRTLADGGQSSALRIRADDPPLGRRPLLERDASFIIGDVLSDRSARMVTFGLGNSLNTTFWSAVKTGTSKDMRDNWCIGFTPRFTVAVWVGNFEGDPMHDVSGVTGAAPVWREIIDGLQAEDASPAPRPPHGVRAASVGFSSGVETRRREWFLSGTAPRHTIDSIPTDVQIAHISSPVNGTIIALDPDIPTDRQRVPIRVEGGTTNLVVRLNDTAVGHAGEVILWSPSSGRYRLSLEGGNGQSVDQVSFTVR